MLIRTDNDIKPSEITPEADFRARRTLLQVDGWRAGGFSLPAGAGPGQPDGAVGGSPEPAVVDGEADGGSARHGLLQLL